MKNSKTLTEWLDKKGMSIYQLLSLAFVPRRTFLAITKDGERRLADMQRLYTVTSLDEFKISPEEEIVLKNKWTELNTIDLMIMEKLFGMFTHDPASFTVDHQLVIGQHKMRDKRNFAYQLLRKYFPEYKATIKLAKVSTSSLKTQNNKQSFLSVSVKELHALFKKNDPDAIKDFLDEGTNRVDARELLQLLQVLGGASPVSIYQTLTSKK